MRARCGSGILARSPHLPAIVGGGDGAVARTSPWGRTVGVLVIVAVPSPLVVAWHYARLGWRDKHVNYPSRPTGYTQIVNRFGQPCSARGVGDLDAVDGGRHRRDVHVPVPPQARRLSDRDGLGQGRQVDEPRQRRLRSHPERPSPAVRRARHLRLLLPRPSGHSSEWSTHAFGIAIDVSSAEEYMGKCTSTVNRNHASIWETARVVLGPRVLRPDALPVRGRLLNRDRIASSKTVHRRYAAGSGRSASSPRSWSSSDRGAAIAGAAAVTDRRSVPTMPTDTGAGELLLVVLGGVYPTRAEAETAAAAMVFGDVQGYYVAPVGQFQGFRRTGRAPRRLRARVRVPNRGGCATFVAIAQAYGTRRRSFPSGSSASGACTRGSDRKRARTGRAP